MLISWSVLKKVTSGKHLEYQVMPIGLTNAPAMFQKLVNEILRDMLNSFVFV